LCSTRLCCAQSLGFRRLFLSASTVLVRTHDGTVDHGVFVVSIGCQHLKYLLPDAGFGPTGKSCVGLYWITEALRQVPPGNTCSIAVENGFHEQPIVLGCNPDMALPSRQKILDPLPLVVSQGVSSHGSAPNHLTSHESCTQTLGNPLIEDRP